MPDSTARGDAVGVEGGDRPSDAAVPSELPTSAWWAILRRAGGHVMEHRLPLLAAGVAFFAVLSVAPVLVTALSVYGAVNTPQEAMRQLSELSEPLPPELEPLVADQLSSIAAASSRVLTLQGAFGLAVALWTATTAMVSLMDALTVAYHERETRGFLRRSGLALALVLAGAVLLSAVLVVTGIVSDAVRDAPGVVHVLVAVGAWSGLAVGMTVGLAVLYRVGPDRRQPRWSWVTRGSATATLLWLLTSLALFAYVQRLGTYESTYGSLAGVAISMFWLWITVVLVLLGAALNGEAERQTARDSTVGPDKPLGERGAVVADSVPPYPRA